MLSQAPLWGLVFLLTGMTLDAMRGGAPSFASAMPTAKSGAIKGAVFSGVLMGLLQIIAAIAKTGLVGSSISFVVVGALVFPLAKTIVETFDGSRSFFGRAAGSYKDPVLYVRGIVAGLAFAIGLHIDFGSLETATRIGYGAAFGGLAALLSMLNSCSGGVAVVNIDNGFGAAQFADLILKRTSP